MNIIKYNKLRHIRDDLKLITQLSYNISQFDKKFPIDNCQDSDIPSLVSVYEDFKNELSKALEIISKDIDSIK